ncbi:hypothetical protein IKF04_03130 [Candidatus Saccharibacteria bacterium]|nr:hypothetical protein [Candidatus Saccharibacteria bacterium]
MPNDNPTTSSSDNSFGSSNSSSPSMSGSKDEPILDPGSIPAPVSSGSSADDSSTTISDDTPTPIIPRVSTDNSRSKSHQDESKHDSVDEEKISEDEDSSPSEDTLSLREPEKSSGQIPEIYAEVVNRISESKNVLIALSSNPSVDEMAAAIGLSIYLDKLGKRATAIYSGTTPNALEFLKPERTFEPSADTLQDFVIALSKEKADHLRYKLDGSFVKIYITPYKSRIAEEDLEFSYGDYNVDLVLALDVANGIDLDSALREHGRIMHDAVIVNITTGKPGKFGEIEWTDQEASSISEMIAKLLYSIDSEIKVGKEEATAFLTGIVAATNRFSDTNTTPETMRISSLLMESGANQQLVSKNITPDTGLKPAGSALSSEHKPKSKPSHLRFERDNFFDERPKKFEPTRAESPKSTSSKTDSKILDDLKAAAESLSHAGSETTPETAEEPFKINSDKMEFLSSTERGARESLKNRPVNSGTTLPPKNSIPTPPPVPKESSGSSVTSIVDRFKMADEPQLSGSSGSSTETPISHPPRSPQEPPKEPPFVNHLAASIPSVPSSPEINGVPEINYMPMPDDNILPPPPAPPIPPVDSLVPPVNIVTPSSADAPAPVAPSVEPASSVNDVTTPSSPVTPAPVPPIGSTSIPPIDSTVIPPVNLPNVATASDNPVQSSALPEVPPPTPQNPPVATPDPGAFKIPGM